VPVSIWSWGRFIDTTDGKGSGGSGSNIYWTKDDPDSISNKLVSFFLWHVLGISILVIFGDLDWL